MKIFPLELCASFPLSTAPMGGIGGSPPPRVIRTSEPKIKVMTGNLGPKQNLFSLTVCALEQYLTTGSKRRVLLPWSPVLKWDQHCLSLSAVKTTKSKGISGPT